MRYITAGRLLDGLSDTVEKAVFVAIRDGLIDAIGPVAELPPHDQRDIDDYSHCILVAPLVDASVYLGRSPSLTTNSPGASPPPEGLFRPEMAKKHLGYCRGYGILGLLANDIPEGWSFSQHPQDTSPTSVHLSSAARPSWDDEQQQWLVPQGSDIVKIQYSPDIDDGLIPNPPLSPTALAELLHREKRRRRIVIANGRQAVGEALAAGCDAIEQGYAMGRDNLQRMADNGILWIPTVIRVKNRLDGTSSGGEVCCRFSQRYVAPGEQLPGAQEYWQQTLEQQLGQLEKAKRLGVPLVLGTGAGSPGILHGESIIEEMKLFLQAGFSLEETIRCGSETPARFLNLQDLGGLEVGRKATFLLVRGSVKQLPRKFALLEKIYIDGAPCATYRKDHFS